MPWISRFWNTLRRRRVEGEIDEELESHIAEAVEQGRDAEEARRAFGASLRIREESRDVRLLPWLDSLGADLVFGWRQIKKHRVASAAAIVSLGLAAGASTTAFRLTDALLLRPLPVAAPERLYAMFTKGYDPGGNLRLGESNEYPQFALMRAAVKDEAELIAAGYGETGELTYGASQDPEKVHKQFVSGWMFEAFGLRPALGRLLAESDDLKPRSHPVAVLSYDYWRRRFGRDPGVLGKTFRMDGDLYQVVGVGPESFTGTEPGTMTEVFLPAMMNPGVTQDEWSWFRTYIRMKPGASVERVQGRLQAVYASVQGERAKRFTNWPKKRMENFLNQQVLVLPASGGLSYVRKEYGKPLKVLGVLAGLVLLIACANVANLLTGQAASRAREMALRVSIGAGRGRLFQLVLVESVLLAIMANGAGAAFAWWAAPYVVASINPPDDPARLDLPADWRVIGFGLALTLGVAVLFGLLPALKASGARPASALKGGEDPHARRRLMHGLIAVQAAFCCVVLFVSGLLVTSFKRLTDQPTGFSSARLLAVQVLANPKQSPAAWNELMEHLRRQPGVEQVAMAGWPLLNGVGANNFVSINGVVAGDRLAYRLNVSPGWLETMKIPLVEGRDFRPQDTDPGTAIVNQAFVREYFAGVSPIGRQFGMGPAALEVIGVARDARYRNMREPITPTAYVPIRPRNNSERIGATIMVRAASGNPLALAGMLRREVSRARSEFRVSNLRTQEEINRSQSLRERLLANLAAFFGLVALVLAAVGLYGVLDYSVLQRRREIGIRVAVGAPAAGLARIVVSDAFLMVACGATAGSGLGLAAGRYLDALLFGVKATDAGVLAGAMTILFAVTLLAAIAPVARAVRTDPVKVLRVD